MIVPAQLLRFNAHMPRASLPRKLYNYRRFDVFCLRALAHAVKAGPWRYEREWREVEEKSGIRQFGFRVTASISASNATQR